MIEELQQAAPEESEQNLRRILGGFLFSGDDIRKSISVLSGGEKARVALVKVESSPSIFLQGMVGSHMPVAIAHGEGRAEFADTQAFEALNTSGFTALRYIDNELNVTERYPANPNGSPAGISGVTSEDGRVTLMMPHPERVCRAVTNSWYPDDWSEDGAWMRLFRNARVFVQ